MSKPPSGEWFENGLRTRVLTVKILEETSSKKKRKEIARLEAWREKKKVENTFSPAHSLPQPSSSLSLSKTIPWTNHRPPSMTDIPQLDGDIYLVDPGSSVRNPSSPNQSFQKSRTLKFTGMNLNLTSA